MITSNITWNDAYEKAVKLFNNGTFENNEEIIELLEYAFHKGLNRSIDKGSYIAGAKILSRIYMRTGKYDYALNYLNSMLENDEKQDWIVIDFLICQIMTENIEILINTPKFLFERLDSLSNKSIVDKSNVYSIFLDRIKTLENIDTEIPFEYFDKMAEKYIIKDVVLESDDEDEEIVENNEIIESQKASLEEKDRIIEKLQKEKDKYLSVIEQYEKDKIGLDEILDNFKKEIENVKNEKNVLKDSNAINVKTINELTKTVETLKGQLDKTKDYDLEKYEKEIERLNEVIKEKDQALINIRNFEKNEKNNSKMLELDLPLLQNNEKILVLGKLDIDKKYLIGIIKKEYSDKGINEDDFEFSSDYDKITNFQVKQNHTIIIAGPMPHMTKDSDGYSSSLEKFAQDNNKYLVKCTSNGELKITKTSFRTALEKVYKYLDSTR